MIVLKLEENFIVVKLGNDWTKITLKIASVGEKNQWKVEVIIEKKRIKVKKEER